jgi:hypothetical protein
MFDEQKVNMNKQHSKYLLIFLCFCLSLVQFGCVYESPQNNKFDSVTFATNLKSNATSNDGKKAAYYGGRIYYLASEHGTQGIYSMSDSGGDIRLEIPVADIRAISIQADGIYYSGFAGVKKNDNGPYRQFRLFYRNNGVDISQDFLSAAVYTDNLRDENVWDFYISQSGVFVLRFINIIGYNGSSELSIACFKDGKAITLSDYQILEDNTSLNNKSANQAFLYFARLDNFFVDLGNTSYEKPEETELLFGRCSISVYDAIQQRVALPIDRMYSAFYASSDSECPRWFCRIDQDKIVFGSVRGLEIYNISTRTMSDFVTFSAPESVYNQLDFGDFFLVFTENLRSSYFNGIYAPNTYPLNRALSESLYRVNPETGEKQLLLSVGRNHAFLYADRQTAVTGGGKMISVYDISGDSAVLLKTIQVKHTIVDRANKVDSAGGWLFLYRFNSGTQRDELIEKVFIGS